MDGDMLLELSAAVLSATLTTARAAPGRDWTTTVHLTYRGDAQVHALIGLGEDPLGAIGAFGRTRVRPRGLQAVHVIAETTDGRLMINGQLVTVALPPVATVAYLDPTADWAVSGPVPLSRIAGTPAAALLAGVATVPRWSPRRWW